MHYLKHNLLVIFTIFTSLLSIGQDIITADGISMGPKAIFMDVCTENMGSQMPESDMPYNVYDFCDCMANELLPTYTKKQINYYFTQNHMDEMLMDSISNQIIMNCVSKNAQSTPVIPPPMSMPAASNEHIIDSIVETCRYEQFFELLKEDVIQTYAKNKNWSSKTIDEVRLKIDYSHFQDFMYYNAYSSENQQELLDLLNDCESIKNEPITKDLTVFRSIVITNYNNYIRSICDKH